MKTHFTETLANELNNQEVGGSSYSRMTDELMGKMEKMMEQLNEKWLPLNTTTNETAVERINDYYNTTKFTLKMMTATLISLCKMWMKERWTS